MIGKNRAGPTRFAHTGTDQAEPSMRDLILEVAVVPGVVAGLLEAARRGRAAILCI